MRFTFYDVRFTRCSPLAALARSPCDRRVDRKSSLSLSLSFQLKPVVLDDRVAQNLAAGVIDLLVRGFFVRARELAFQILADMHGADAGVAHLGQGVLHALPLR